MSSDDLLDPDGTEGVYVELDHVGSGRVRRTTTGAIAALAGSAAADAIASVTVVVTAAELATLFSAPPEIVAAPGAGKAIIPITFVFETVPGIGAFSGGDTAAVYSTDSPPAFIPGPNNTGYGGSIASRLLQSVAAVDGRQPIADVTISGPLEMGNNIVNAQEELATTWLRATIENQPLALARIDDDPFPIGPLPVGSITADIEDGGHGYAVNDTGTVDEDVFAGGATYRVTAVSSGVVTGLTIVAGGDGYVAGDTQTTTPGGGHPGSGTGLTVTPSTINTAAMTSALRVTTIYRILTLA